MSTKNNTSFPGRYVVAKGAQIDTRKNERARAAGRPPGPSNGLSTSSGDVLKAGDAISADDLEGGAAQLEQLINQAAVVPERGLPTIAPRSGLMVAPGRSTITGRGVLGPGSEIHPNEIGKTDLENLIDRGVILRVKPGAALSAEPPPEAA